MSAPTRPVLRYHGGKWKLAPWLISFFPEHRVYVEPFGGGASVLMRKPRSYAEVYNDKWDTVANVFRILRNSAAAERLKRQIELTPYARSEFELCSAIRPKRRYDIEAARLTLFRANSGFGSAAVNGEFSTGFRTKTRNSYTTPFTDWREYPKFIGVFCERLRGVLIENRDALEVLQKHGTLETLFYCDPPYLQETRNMQRGNATYACEMTTEQHGELAETLNRCKGMVILSGYPCDLYDKELYPNWHRFEKAHLADGARPRTEVIWLNDAAYERMPQKRLL